MADQSAWQVPQDVVRLGSYRVLAELARGGMAAVFLGMREPRQGGAPQELRDLSAAGRVDDDPLRVARVVESDPDLAAIKQIHAHLAHDPDFVAMLMDEARIATKIHHPNVVQIRECRLGDGDGTNFIVMEYVAGESLSTLMRQSMAKGVRFTPALAASVGADVAGALHTAHELRGPGGEPLELVHRDVSPQNVLIRYDGRVKLTDFGVAKAVGRLQRTQPGEIKGKLAYMAPEQAYGRAVDRRSDVYSLGVVLFELALGRRLFGGRSDAETVRNIMQHNVPAPRSVDPQFPVGLEEIILGMLQADPSQRFQSAGAVERALRAFVASSGERDIDARLGELSRTLEPARYRAKTDLVVRELLAEGPHAHPAPFAPPREPTPPRPATGSGGGGAGERTMMPGQRPPRVATQAAPKARGPEAPAAAQPLDPLGLDRTIPMAAQARAAVAAVSPTTTVSEPTQPTLRRADILATTPEGNPDPTSPSFQNPAGAERFERTLMADGARETPTPVVDRPPTPSLRPPPPPQQGIDQTMLSVVPPQVMQQIEQAQQGPTSLPPVAEQPRRPTSRPPAPDNQKGLWTVVAVGMVLFVLAALFVLSRLR